MSTPSDSRDDYLWDPQAAPSDEGVARVERAMARWRFDATTPPAWPARDTAAMDRRPARMRLRVALAAAAVLILSAAGAAAWRWTWPEGRGWPMTPAGGASAAAATSVFEVGRAVVTPAGASAQVQVARIGSMTIRPGSEIELRSTASNAHRLALARGTIDVSVWAPPGAVVVQTPAGRVIDVGCAFTLEVDDEGVSHVAVTSGWVQLDNFHGEVLVPAGASSEMPPGAAPLVPVYDDAVPAFREAARAAEQAARAGAPVRVEAAWLSAARPRDVLTLLALARALPPEQRRALVERAAELSPPPSGISAEAVAAGDRDASWAWQDALPLPPPKRWWRNWRDGF